MRVFVTILENGRYLGFPIYQSERIYLITLEMSHANVHPKNAKCLLYCKGVATCPNGNVTTCPNVISITKFLIAEI